jgi:hypothetical protein
MLYHYPTTKKAAKKYASDLTTLHGEKWIAIERIVPLKSKLTPDFAAIKETEKMIAGWQVVG